MQPFCSGFSGSWTRKWAAPHDLPEPHYISADANPSLYETPYVTASFQFITSSPLSSSSCPSVVHRDGRPPEPRLSYTYTGEGQSGLWGALTHDYWQHDVIRRRVPTTSFDDEFPNDDFFPDIDNHCGNLNMDDNQDPAAAANIVADAAAANDGRRKLTRSSMPCLRWLFSILADNIVDPYMTFEHDKDAWDALEAKFGVSDAGTVLYVMEQYYDYKMTGERSVVEQAHEIQSLAKELEQFNCTLPDNFVAGGIITKLSPSWRKFATSLKHKRQEFSVSNLIGSLHVEEKARAKDTLAREFEEGSSANVVQKKNFQSHKFKNKNKSEGKGKFDGKNKASHSTNFKKKTDKKKGACHFYGEPDHWAPNCPNRYDKRGNGGKTVKLLLAVASTCSVLMGNGSCVSVHGLGTSNDATFFEDIFPMKDTSSSSNQEIPSSSSQELITIPEPTIAIDHYDNPVEDDNEAPKRSKTQRNAKSFGHDFVVYLVDDTPTSISELYASQDAD
ncbi:hypothetical protein QYE76_028138 [Lolium multiflorum]|uniref:Uncharacterized protein n=1 Tax=Lolium multiflorum TaxID=4521 RepID=A0AAD8QLB7_LOLMU|nr:hypothetical protein QYE76_028138 [Lolium multiflorum]